MPVCAAIVYASRLLERGGVRWRRRDVLAKSQMRASSSACVGSYPSWPPTKSSQGKPSGHRSRPSAECLRAQRRNPSRGKHVPHIAQTVTGQVRPRRAVNPRSSLHPTRTTAKGEAASDRSINGDGDQAQPAGASSSSLYVCAVYLYSRTSPCRREFDQVPTACLHSGSAYIYTYTSACTYGRRQAYDYTSGGPASGRVL